jgi:NAD-dependent deacetylase
MKKNLVVFTGAGISAESGIQTFRAADGLWEGHNAEDVATPQGFSKNPALVLDFYNQRRRQLLTVKPNAAHLILAELENDFNVHVITQNVDNLHEKAGSSNVLHLHGELLKVRSTVNKYEILDWDKDLVLGDLDKNGNQLRPHIVWFGEMVPELENAVDIVSNADIFLIVGTSLQVYPAASLIEFCNEKTKIYYIDPNPASVTHIALDVKIIAQKASIGMKTIEKELKKLL